MNRRKTIDYTVTRRPRDSHGQLNTSKSREDDRDQRSHDGKQAKKPFWSGDDDNWGKDSKYSSLQRDAVLKSLQEEISRSVHSQETRDSHSRERATGSVTMGEFSKDAYSSHSRSNSKKVESRDARGKQRKERNDRKRSYSPVDDKTSYSKSREDTTTKRSRSTNLGGLRDDDDLRNVLTQYQKSKWDDDDSRSRDRRQYDSKDRERNSDLKGSYRDKNHQPINRERRNSREYSSGDYTLSKQENRESISDRLRALSGDHEESMYGLDQDNARNAGIGDSLQSFDDLSLFKSSSFSSDTLQVLSLPSLAGRATEKYRSNFELGRPFFGFESEDQGKAQGHQESKFGGDAKRDEVWGVSTDSVPGQRETRFSDIFRSDSFLVASDGKERMKDQLASQNPSSKAQQNERDKSSTLTVGLKVGNHITSSIKSVTTGSKGSPSTSTNTGVKPLFRSGFLPRQVKAPLGKNAQKVGQSQKSDSPPPLSKKSGYFPRSTDQKSRSRSRSSERDDIFSTLGNNSNLNRESKGTFTSQNWSCLGGNENKDKSKENKFLVSPQQLVESIHGRGGMIKNNGSRGGLQQRPPGRGDTTAKNPGRGRARRGRGRGVTAGNRGRGVNLRGRGIAIRGRGRGLSQRGHLPIGATVRNIFRKSSSPSQTEGRHQRSSRSPGSSRGNESRGRKEKRSRSRSSSYCSTCSSGSCSTCHSRRSRSLDGLSERKHKGSHRHIHHHEKRSNLQGDDRKSQEALEKLKADIKFMEKELDEKKVSDTSAKKSSEQKAGEKSFKDTAKSKTDPQNSKDTPRSTLHPKTTKDIPKSKLDPKKSKEKEKSNLDPKNNKDMPKSNLEVKASNDLSKRKVVSKTTKEVLRDKLDPRASKSDAKSTVYTKSTGDVSKSKLDSRKSTKDLSKSKSETKSTRSVSKDESGKLRDQKGLWKGHSVEEERSKSPFESKREFEKKSESSREVIFKSDKRKESPIVVKKEKDSPAREVKIISEKRNKGNRAHEEQMGSEMKIDSLKITIDQSDRALGGKKYLRRSGRDSERSTRETNRSSSKSPPGKQKKKEKEKVKSKKAKKKSKKRKQDRRSSESEDDSVYSSTSSFDKGSQYMLHSPGERIVDFYPEAHESNKIAVHSAKRKRSDTNYPSIQQLSEREALKGTSSRSNLITIPLSREVTVHQSFEQNVKGGPPSLPERHEVPGKKEGRVEDNSDLIYSEVSYTGTDPNVNWEGTEFAEEHENQIDGTLYQDSEVQEWVPEYEEGAEYCYQEGAEGEVYEEEHYSYNEEEAWQANEEGEGEYHEEEWYGDEYTQEGVEGEEGELAEYEGQYYLGEDGLYYPVDSEAYEDYQGEYNEGAVEGMTAYPEESVHNAADDHGYEHLEEGTEWVQYEDGTTYQGEEGWGQSEVEVQWAEQQEGYAGEEAGWNAEYSQGDEYEATGQVYDTEAESFMPQENYGVGEEQGFEQQLAQDQCYAEPPVESHQPEHMFQSGVQEESMEPIFVAKDESDSSVKDNQEEIKPLKSILKKSKYGQNMGTKLVSERLAQLKSQGTNKLETPQLGNTTNSFAKTNENAKQNAEKQVASSAQTEAEKYREMEEAILSSQPKDAVGAEYVVRLRESGTANFFCQLCKCHFNTLTAKNLHVKGMKHIELYVRLKSSLLKSVIKDTKTDTLKRPSGQDPSTGGKLPF